MGSLIVKLNKLFKDQLIQGSMIVFLGSNIVNVSNYLYHLYMGRYLGPENYGELVSIFSLLGLLMMIPGSANLTIVKFVTANKTYEDTQAVMGWFCKKSYIVALVLFFVTLLSVPVMSSFLHLSSLWNLSLIPITALFGIPALFNRAILQGLLKFNQSVLSVMGENLAKLVFGMVLVYLGFSLLGAIIGVAISIIIGWILTFVLLNRFRLKKISEKPIPIKNIVKYTVPVLLQSIAATSLISTDILLVKHFFSAYDAGLYAALSTLGKVILYCSGPIGVVMFPLASKKQSNDENFYSVFFLSLILTLFISLLVLTCYFFIPQLAISMLYGQHYLSAASNLVWFGVFITFYTLSALIISFFLSVGKTWIFVPALIAALSQAVGIWFFHNSLSDVITVSVVSSLILFISLSSYLIYDYVSFKKSSLQS